MYKNIKCLGSLTVSIILLKFIRELQTLQKPNSIGYMNYLFEFHENK